ncbi:hypothetical protein [Kitasatospora sp. NPDC005856]|uniref:hypothetical protein n=1 Tax=Kitasatospora sp. NPDC005856 TaxID=3154566 RepID=UPI0033F8A1C0
MKLTGTRRHGEVEEVGYGAYVQLTSAGGVLKCEEYLQYSRRDGVEVLEMSDLESCGGFLRVGADLSAGPHDADAEAGTNTGDPYGRRSVVPPPPGRRCAVKGAVDRCRPGGTSDPRPVVSGPTYVTVDGFAKANPAKLTAIMSTDAWQEERILCQVPPELTGELGKD